MLDLGSENMSPAQSSGSFDWWIASYGLRLARILSIGDEHDSRRGKNKPHRPQLLVFSLGSAASGYGPIFPSSIIQHNTQSLLPTIASISRLPHISSQIGRLSIRSLPAAAEELRPKEDAHKIIRKIVELRHLRFRWVGLEPT